MTTEITIDGKEITLNGNSITFFDEGMGLELTVVPQTLSFNIGTKAVTVRAVAKVTSPTGQLVNQIDLGMLAMDFEFTEFESQEFQGKYLNGLFRSVMSRFGLAAHQVISEETGEVEVIRDVPTPTQYPSWIQPTGAHDAYPQGQKVKHNGKNWESTVANNVWEPGVSNWRELT